MKIRLQWLIVLLLSLPVMVAAQNDTLIKKLDSLKNQKDSLGLKQDNNIRRTNYNETTEITFKNYFLLLADDFKQDVTEPFHTSKKDWAKVGGFALITGAAFFIDEPVQRFAFDVNQHNAGVHNIGRYVTNFGAMYEVYTLGALGAYGWLFKNKKIQTTTLLATQSYITAAAFSTFFKIITGRDRPEQHALDAAPDPIFHGPFHSSLINQYGTSFPSGHTTLAFAAATVYAMEYRDRPIIPFISYGAATLVGLSRITENRHWATDVLTGAALGYLCGRQVVNNFHRYAKIQNEKKRNAPSVSFHPNYFYGKVLPAVTVTF